MAWVALTVFLTANGLALAHICLPIPSCHHDEARDAAQPKTFCKHCRANNDRRILSESADRKHDEHHDADHSFCPCQSEHPDKPCCPCPGGCPSCNIAKTLSVGSIVSMPEPAVCLEQHSFDAPLPYLAPSHGQLIRPPRV